MRIIKPDIDVNFVTCVECGNYGNVLDTQRFTIKAKNFKFKSVHGKYMDIACPNCNNPGMILRHSLHNGQHAYLVNCLRCDLYLGYDEEYIKRHQKLM